MKIYLTKGKGFIARAIMWFTDSDISHLAIEDPERPFIIHSVGSGCRKMSLDKFYKKYDIKYTFEYLPAYNNYDEALRSFISFEAKYLATEYDYKQIFGFVLYYIFKWFGYKGKRNFFDGVKPICSELEYVRLQHDIDNGVSGIPDNALQSFEKGIFSPESAKRMMILNNKVYREC